MDKHPAIQRILTHKREEIRLLKDIYPQKALEEKAAIRDRHHSIISAMDGNREGYNVIAEIKRSSPSLCFKPLGFDPVSIASSYQVAGAAAISVLTESRFFSGSSSYIPLVRSAVSLPVLRKDFVVDQWQVAEAAALGADAVLLMAINHESSAEFGELYDYALSMNIEPLVEIHSEEEWRFVESVAPKLVGVNNRDFYSPDLKVDLNTSLNLAPMLPKEVTVISESGISGRDQLEKLKSVGVSGFLIGSSLMKDDDPGKALTKLIS